MPATDPSVELVAGRPGKRLDYQRVEEDLLRTARHMIHDNGFHELTMASLAKASGYTRKTVYNHFANIEDAVVAVCLQSVTRRADLVSRAAQYRARARERIAGIASVARVLLPHHLPHEVLLASIKIDRVKDERRRRLQAQEERLFAVNAGVIRAAVASGDLDLPPTLSPEQLALTLLQIESGPVLRALRGFRVGGYSTEESLETFAYTLTVLLDDLGWRPLSTELDYPASIRRMWREVFPDLLDRFGISV